MPASLVWGKEFKLEDSSSPLGGRQHVVGVDGGLEILSWTSVEAMESLAEEHGVDRQIWPIYPDCEESIEVPLDDVRWRSNALRIALGGMDPRVIEGSHWLSVIYRLLQDGNFLFIVR